MAAQYLKDPEDKSQWDTSEPMWQRLADRVDAMLDRMEQLLSTIEATMELDDDLDLSDHMEEDSNVEVDYPTDEDSVDSEDSDEEKVHPRK